MPHNHRSAKKYSAFKHTAPCPHILCIAMQKACTHTQAACCIPRCANPSTSTETHMNSFALKITSSILHKLKRRTQSLARHHRAMRVSQNKSQRRDLDRRRCEKERSGIRLRGQGAVRQGVRRE